MSGDRLQWIENLISECEIREPPINIYQLIRFYDQLEIEFRYLSKDFEGTCLSFGDLVGKIIVLNGNFDLLWYRRRFTAAHEFGHALFHQGYDLNNLRKRELNKIERESNSFAAMILVPQILLEQLHSAYGFLCAGMISNLFGVSKEAARYRLYAFQQINYNRGERRRIDRIESRLYQDFLYADIPDKVAHWKAVQLVIHGPQMMPFCLRCGRVKLDEYPKVCWGCGKDTTQYISAPPTPLFIRTGKQKEIDNALGVEFLR